MVGNRHEIQQEIHRLNALERKVRKKRELMESLLAASADLDGELQEMVVEPVSSPESKVLTEGVKTSVSKSRKRSCADLILNELSDGKPLSAGQLYATFVHQGNKFSRQAIAYNLRRMRDAHELKRVGSREPNTSYAYKLAR